MPELPEVESTKISLLPVKGSKIVEVYSSGKKLRKEIPQNLIELKNTIILDVQRKAKYLLFNLYNKSSSNQKTIISHLGMSGKFIYSADSNINKHDHIILYLEDGNTLKYNDPRRFGIFLLEDTNNYENKIFSKIAMDAIDASFTPNYLQNKLLKISRNIKNTLLNQEIVAGIGNIYASEALFKAKINPTREANSLTYKEITYLVDAIKEILNKAINLGGSTLKDYRKANGELGDFQNHFLVYSRENESCLEKNCEGTVEKIIQNGRSTFYCKKTQK